jgi:hypothetical protein
MLLSLFHPYQPSRSFFRTFGWFSTRFWVFVTGVKEVGVKEGESSGSSPQKPLS